MDKITGFFRVPDRPRSVVQVANPGILLMLNGPLRMGIDPAPLGLDAGLAIRVDDDFQVLLLQAGSQVGNEQFRSTILGGWNWNQRRRNKGDSQLAP